MLSDIGWRSRINVVRTLIPFFLCGTLAFAARVAHAVDFAELISFSIPPQALSSALVQFADQAGVQLTAPGASLDGVRTDGVQGKYRRTIALSLILRDTGFNYRIVDDGTIAITGPPKSPRTADPAAVTATPQEQEQEQEQDGKASSSDGAQPAAVARSATPSSESRQPGDPSAEGNLAEVIVTAQKRNERLQDVPVPVTVLDTEVLATRNESRLQDYFASVPGLNLAQVGGGQQSIAIRGITTSFIANPTVGITIDDVPYGSSTLLGYGSTVLPDLDPGDLSSIEVLRGPQGTLYGASSMGGLLKYNTKDPSFATVSGRVQVYGDGVQHGDAGYGARGSVNIPVSDTLAIRASGFARRDSGYIDNLTTGRSAVNRADAYGSQVAALWQPSDVLSLKLSALLQNTESDGTELVDTNQALQPVFGDLSQVRPHNEPWSVAVRLFTAVLKASLGGADFTAVSGYGNNIYHQSFDSTSAFGAAAQTYFNVPEASFINDFDTRKYSQEFRLASANRQTLEWLVGVFYTHESSAADQFAAALNPTSGAQVGRPIDYNFPTTVDEYAVFGDVTLHFTDKFDVQVGGRGSENRQIYNETDTGPLTPMYFGAPSPFVNVTERTNEHAFTYLLTPRYRLSPDLMLYARFSSGYRVGGNNVNAVIGDVPPHFNPDKTYNYEFGLKGDLLDRKVTFDFSAYYIDWKDIQLSLFSPATGFSYNVNGGSAKSQGLELSVQAKPFTGFSVTAAMSLNDAHLTQDFSASATAVGSSGDPLPYSSRFSGNIDVDQDFPLTGQWTGFVGATATYVGSREGEFVSVFAGGQQRTRFPAYAEFAVRLGARRDVWSINLFANNLTNRRGIVGGGTNYFNSTGFEAVFIQPRTLGVSISRMF